MVKVLLIGITHIDKESQQKVTTYLNKFRPDAVCLELDQYRLDILIENESVQKESESNFIELTEKNDGMDNEKQENDFPSETNDSFFGFTSILEDIGFFESRLASIIQTDQPGNEMLIAYKVAKEIGAEIYLIDRSIHDINSAMAEELSPEEAAKFQELIDELLFEKNIISEPLGENHKNGYLENNSLHEIEEKEEINLNEVVEIFKDEESLTGILTIFKQTFPKLYSILLEDRNDFMIRKIQEVIAKHNSIAIILGYGHVKEVAEGLKKIKEDIEIEIITG
ncbi:MAG: TraB domain-containing protein [Candidatus Thorarchaeota archaeon]